MTKIPKKIKILNLEDLPSDVDLIDSELKKGKFVFEKLVVDNKTDFENALTSFAPDIIFSNHPLPSFNTNAAIDIARKILKEVPFIFITSALPDEEVVSLLQKGVNDYILKDRLHRLNTAVKEALEKSVFEKEKRQFIEQIERNEKRFRTMIEKSIDMITLSNAEGKMMYGSPSIEHIFGYKQNEIINIKATEFIHPDDIAAYLIERTELLKNPGKSIYKQMRLKHKSGRWVWCESTMTNLLEEPEIEAIVSNFRDITEKNKLENERKLDADYLNALINNTNDLMWSVDLDFNLITSNKPFQNIINNFSKIEIKKGTNMFSLGFDEMNHTLFKMLFGRAFKGETFTELIYYTVPSASWSEISFNPIKHNDEIIGCACFSKDVTEKKKGEQEKEKLLSDLIQRSKNLEQFAYIISHNLRAPVAHITGITNLLKTNLSDADRAKSQQYLFEAAEKLDHITRDLNQILQIKADIAEQKQNISFIKILNEVSESLTYSIENELLEIKHDFIKAPQIISIKSYIHSIFHNLISNSIKYRHSFKPLKIEIKSDVIEQKLILSFKDNGIGIDLEKNKDLIFGLYKRFHSEIDGKGAGLFMVKTQVEALGGHIKVISEPGLGAEFIISLPI